VHGNTYKYILREEARLVDVVHARAVEVARAEAAEARIERLEAVLQRIADMAGASGEECASVARDGLGDPSH
jgi:hypothetical protein